MLRQCTGNAGRRLLPGSPGRRAGYPHLCLGPGKLLLHFTQILRLTRSGMLKRLRVQESRLQRSFLQEAMRCVAASPCGTYVAAGGASGTVYVWTAADGCLVASWPGHFKASPWPLSSCDDGCLLICWWHRR